MKIKLILLPLSAVVLNACNGQINNPSTRSRYTITTMAKNSEKFDFEMYKKCDYTGTYTDKNGIEFQLYFDEEIGGRSIEKPRLPNYFKIYKEFYKNGNIKFKKTFLSDAVVGKSQYYDTEGNYINEVDEEEKHFQTGPTEILNFLQQKRHLNLRTGDGWKHIRITFDELKSQWTIQIKTGKVGAGGAIIDDTYVIDTKTGKVVNHLGSPIK